MKVTEREELLQAWIKDPTMPEPRKIVDIHDVLVERGKRYGVFAEHAEISQTLKNVMRETDGWSRLTNSQREALEMHAHKIARILNGDTTYVDNWTDIAGYATLVEQELNGEFV
jgi:nucleoid-associated protein YejK